MAKNKGSRGGSGPSASKLYNEMLDIIAKQEEERKKKKENDIIGS